MLVGNDQSFTPPGADKFGLRQVPPDYWDNPFNWEAIIYTDVSSELAPKLELCMVLF